jgi:acyl-CoA thioesterase-2
VGDEYQPVMPTGLPPPEETAPAAWQNGPWVALDIGPTPPEPDGTFLKTRRVWVRIDDDLPDDARLHTTLAAFVSDLTGSSFRPLSLDEWGVHTDASVDHAVWFHRPFRPDRWLYMEHHAVVCTAGRSVVRGAVYDQAGHLCLTMTQELLIRRL